VAFPGQSKKEVKKKRREYRFNADESKPTQLKNAKSKQQFHDLLSGKLPRHIRFKF